jgi:hypothetical protein
MHNPLCEFDNRCEFLTMERKIDNIKEGVKKLDRRRKATESGGAFKGNRVLPFSFSAIRSK